MSALKDKIQAEQIAAMKARQSDRVQALRMIMAAIKRKEVDERREISDSDVEKLLLTLSKQVQESLDQARGAGRSEAIAEAEFELSVLKSFLPEPMSEAEVKSVVHELAAALRSQS